MSADGPIFVVGTGRSGTSTIARLLHTRLGVCMGHRFVKPDAWNTQGYWEDLDHNRLVRQLERKEIDLDYYLYRMPHKCGAPMWGYKTPMLCDLPDGVIRAANPPLVIQTWRPEADVVASMLRFRRNPIPSRFIEFERRKAQELYRRRAENLKLALAGLNVVTVRMDSRRRTDEELTWELGRRVSREHFLKPSLLESPTT